MNKEQQRAASQRRVIDERDLISPPGATILDTIEHKSISPADLATQMGETLERLEAIIDGRVPLTDTIALRLDWALGIDQQFWINREANYRAKLADLQAKEGAMDSYDRTDLLRIHQEWHDFKKANRYQTGSFEDWFNHHYPLEALK